MPSPERRAFPRELLAIPLRWEDGSNAHTRDVSPEGMYVILEPGAPIPDWVSIEFTAGHSAVGYRAYARVLRVEPGVTSTGVALRLHSARLFTVP